MKWSTGILLFVLVLVAAGVLGLIWYLTPYTSPVQPKQATTEKPPVTVSEAERRAIQEKAETLASLGPEGIAELAKQVREGDETWQVESLRALRALGPDAEPALDALIHTLETAPDLKRKHLAIDALKAIGPRARIAVPAVIKAGKETRDLDGSLRYGGSSNVAEAAVEAVTAIDPTALPQLAEAIIPGLLRMVKSRRDGAANSALRVLGKLGSHVKPALPKLQELLSSLPADSISDCVPVFLAAGDEGKDALADLVVDPNTTSKIKVALMKGYRGERQATPATLRMLRVLLDDEEAEVRVAAVMVLRYVRAKELIPRLVELLADTAITQVPSGDKGDDPCHVANALGNQGKEAIPALIQVLESRDPLVRYQAARALGIVGKDAVDAAGPLEKLLDDPEPYIRVEAARSVLKTGKESPKALNTFENLLHAKSPPLLVTLDTIARLGRAGRPLFPLVKREILASGDYQVQRAGLAAICKIQADPKEIVQIWVVFVKKNPNFLLFPPTDEIRANGQEAAVAVPDLLVYLKDRDMNVRREATEALEAMGPAAAKALPALIEALDDNEWHVSAGAMKALAAMGSLAKPAVPQLLREYEQIKPSGREADYYRKRVLLALASIGPGAEAVPRLLGWLPDNPDVARVLGTIGPDAKAAVPALEKLHDSGKVSKQVWPAFALVKITGKTEPYVSTLVEVFQKNKNLNHRSEALLALVELGPDAKAALPVFLQALKEKGDSKSRPRDFQHDAATALARFGPEAKEAVPALIDMIESYYANKIAAAEALGAIGPDAKAAIPALEQMALEDERYQPVVEKALAKIRGK
jgi:HEAT repeat protein